MSEWCTGCKEYDTEKHCCPRFNNVIRNTMNERINDVLDKIATEIQKLRNCSCSCSDGIIDDVEEILDKYKAESEDIK